VEEDNGVFGGRVYIVHIQKIHSSICLVHEGWVGLGWVGNYKVAILFFLPLRKPSNVKLILAQYHIFASFLVGM
jgi:hypothetical protein